jgi:hypothetical protein
MERERRPVRGASPTTTSAARLTPSPAGVKDKPAYAYWTDGLRALHARIITDDTLTPVDVAVLLGIGPHMDSRGVAYPGTELIASTAKISTRHLYTISRGLAEKGYFTISKKRMGGRWERNIYTFPVASPSVLQASGGPPELQTSDGDYPSPSEDHRNTTGTPSELQASDELQELREHIEEPHPIVPPLEALVEKNGTWRDSQHSEPMPLASSPNPQLVAEPTPTSTGTLTQPLDEKAARKAWVEEQAEAMVRERLGDYYEYQRDDAVHHATRQAARKELWRKLQHDPDSVPA